MQLQFTQVGQVVEVEGLEFAMLASQEIKLPQNLSGFFLVLGAQKSGEGLDLTYLRIDPLTDALFVFWNGIESSCKDDYIFIPVGQSRRKITWSPNALEISVADGVISNVNRVNIVHLEDYISFSSLA